MVVLRADERKIEASGDPEDDAQARADVAALNDIRLRLAQRLVRMERRGQFHLFSCSSIVHYAVRIGLPAAEARSIVALGRTLNSSEALVQAHVAAEPSAADTPIVERVQRGELHVEHASLLGRLFVDGSLVNRGEDWLGVALASSTAELRRRVNERLEEVATGNRALVRLTVHVSERARDEFARARVLASREAGAPLTEGQCFTLIVARYLDAADPERRGALDRRVGPTAERPRDRYVPASVKRAVLARSGDRCEVPGCTHRIFLEYAHVVAHRDDGSREEDNLVRLCHAHHVQLDAGVLQCRSARGAAPAFRDAEGRDIETVGILPGRRACAESADASARGALPEESAREAADAFP